MKNVIAKQNLNLLFNPSLGKRRYDLFFLRQKEIIIKQVKQMMLLNIVKYILVGTTAMLLLKIVKIPKQFFHYLPKDILGSENTITFITCTLQLILLFFDVQSTTLTKINRFMSWLILIVPLFWAYNKHYVIYVNVLRIISSVYQIISLLPSNKIPTQGTTLKNCQFKKISHEINDEWSDEEEEDNIKELNKNVSGNYTPYTPIFNTNTAKNTNIISNNTANNKIFKHFPTNIPSVYEKPLNVDLDTDLNDLHLSDKWKSGFSLHSTPVTVNYTAIRPNRQLLTPPVLNIKTNNCSWKSNNTFSQYEHSQINNLQQKTGYELQPNLFLLDNSALLYKKQILSPFHSTVQFSTYFTNRDQPNNVKFDKMFCNNCTQNQFLFNSIPQSEGISNRLFKNGTMNVFNDTNLSRRTM